MNMPFMTEIITTLSKQWFSFENKQFVIPNLSPFKAGENFVNFFLQHKVLDLVVETLNNFAVIFVVNIWWSFKQFLELICESILWFSLLTNNFLFNFFVDITIFLNTSCSQICLSTYKNTNFTQRLIKV